MDRYSSKGCTINVQFTESSNQLPFVPLKEFQNLVREEKIFLFGPIGCGKSRTIIELFHEEGIALDSFSVNRTDFVIVGGEYWKARSSRGDEEINKGDKIKVVGKEADLFIVEHLYNGEQ
jgi:hypothetical protein